jgi:acyl-CoA synthetase (AMP-forming)/AMP-acid ligase II
VAADAAIKALIVDASCAAEFRDRLKALGQAGVRLIGFGPEHGLELDYESLQSGAPGVVYPPIGPADVAMIAYTSGTTGMPKGVLLPHAAVHESSIYTVLELGFRPDDVRAYVSNPSGLNIYQVCFNTFTGMTTVLDDFEVERFLRLVAKHRITCVTLIPTMLSRVVEAVKQGHHDISSLRQIYYGSMPATPSLIRSAYDTLGCTFMQGYGVSESCGPIAGLDDEDHRRALHGEPEILRSVGRAFMHAEMSVRDDRGNEVPRGTLGTVWIRSSTRMNGYLNLPEETAEAFAGAWLKTGDHGHMDSRGYVFLADRKTHMIISGGMNIYPTSVENAIHEHPAVKEVVVIGVAHPTWGQAVVAAVTLKAGVDATANELIRHCEGKIPRWEIPKHVEIVDELPKGNTDKLDKRALTRSILESGHLPWADAAERASAI